MDLTVTDVELDRRHADIIQQHFTELTDVIETQDGLIDILIAEGVLDLNEAKLIRSREMSDDKNWTLLMILGKKSFLDFELFLSALRRSNQTHVADILTVPNRAVANGKTFQWYYYNLVRLNDKNKHDKVLSNCFVNNNTTIIKVNVILRTHIVPL